MTEKENYQDFAAGRVLLAQGGTTAFPVRLASEIFHRCANSFPTEQRLRVYDPCCGSGYLLTVIGFLHGTRIQSLYGSDVNLNIVSMAADNLRLLTSQGLDTRRDTLRHLADTYHKSAHYDALESVEYLRQCLPVAPINTQTWVADALQPTTETASFDLILCDVPYGNITGWQAAADNNLITSLLQAQYDGLVSGGIIAVVSDKSQKATYPRYKRLQQDMIGKRRFLILQKV